LTICAAGPVKGSQNAYYAACYRKQQGILFGNGPHVRGNALTCLVGEFADDRPGGLFRIVRHKRQVEADEFVVGLDELESLLARTNFRGDPVQLVAEIVSESPGKDQRKHEALVFRRVPGSADRTGGIPDPELEGLVFLSPSGCFVPS